MLTASLPNTSASRAGMEADILIVTDLEHQSRLRSEFTARAHVQEARPGQRMSIKRADI